MSLSRSWNSRPWMLTIRKPPFSGSLSGSRGSAAIARELAAELAGVTAPVPPAGAAPGASAPTGLGAPAGFGAPASLAAPSAAPVMTAPAVRGALGGPSALGVVPVPRVRETAAVSAVSARAAGASNTPANNAHTTLRMVRPRAGGIGAAILADVLLGPASVDIDTPVVERERRVVACAGLGHPVPPPLPPAVGPSIQGAARDH